MPLLNPLDGTTGRVMPPIGRTPIGMPIGMPIGRLMPIPMPMPPPIPPRPPRWASASEGIARSKTAPSIKNPAIDAILRNMKAPPLVERLSSAMQIAPRDDSRERHDLHLHETQARCRKFVHTAIIAVTITDTPSYDFTNCSSGLLTRLARSVAKSSNCRAFSHDDARGRRDFDGLGSWSSSGPC